MVDELVILQSDPDLQSGPFQHLTKEEVGGVETSTCLNIAIFSVFTPTRPDPTDLEPDSTDVDMDMSSFTLLLRSSLRHFYVLSVWSMGAGRSSSRRYSLHWISVYWFCRFEFPKRFNRMYHLSFRTLDFGPRNTPRPATRRG